ncbi:UNVERIFIED_CONTAM: Retrovirus-related Pol polyprotein from transposon TNT 1-94 [Sesamum latifolium]|uniref:Retrovirus-related Pol polyprotein from transposon TNT 1-94 n=1 Tax=Sesamum latifolium TaxID=2727402 RepID=A0AAW2X0H4_9LAMI
MELGRGDRVFAMVEDMESLQKNHTWELVQLPEGKKAIGCKWVYKKKPAVSKNKGEKFKARLAVLALVASWDLHLEQMDVKTMFLHGDLEEQIYMEQPDGFTQPGHEHLVCKLKKSLYGLKQSPRQCYKRLDSYMFQINYKWCEYNCCVYVKSLDDGYFIFLLLYIDDMLIAAKNMHDVLALKALLSQEFGYVEKVLDRFGMSKVKLVSTPLANHFKLSSEQCPKIDSKIEDMAKVPYASAVGYLIYLKGTVGHGVVFGSQQNDPLVVGYVDSDYAGDLDDIRFTTGYVFTLGGGPICWKSTVQSIVALSTIEAEYMAVAEAAKEALWLNGLAKEMGVEQGGVQLHCDSQSAIYLAKNQVYHARTKHIDVRYYKIREFIASREILLQKVHTSENAADILTKPLTIDKFNHCLDLLSVYSC